MFIVMVCVPDLDWYCQTNSSNQVMFKSSPWYKLICHFGILGNHVTVFESSKINHGGITTDARGNEITHGCSGKLIATPQFERGDIE